VKLLDRIKHVLAGEQEPKARPSPWSRPQPSEDASPLDDRDVERDPQGQRPERRRSKRI
jgi:hypothetical protein